MITSNLKNKIIVTVKENINPHIKVTFICFSDSDYKTYLSKIKEND